MHSHIFVPSIKKEVSYCKKCSILSYRGNISQEMPIKMYNKFDIDPLKLKFKPVSITANYNLEFHRRYLESKIIGINKIKYLVNNFGLKSMVYYKSINFMNQIFLEKEISIDNIENIASLIVLLVVEFNDCCFPSIAEELILENDILYHFHSKNEFQRNKKNNELVNNKINFLNLFHFIKKNVNNYKYWEMICLRNLNYDLGKYSAYDYLILFFQLGIFFCKEKINTLDLLKYCINLLDFITNDKKSCEYSQYILAMSIIKVALDNNVFFDKDVFKYIYGVDLSKKKYINCSNMIKNILNVSCNIDNSINLFFNNQILLNPQLFIDKCIHLMNRKEEEKNEKKINNNIKNNNELINLGNFPYMINNNNIIISNNFIDNNININNTNFYYGNCIVSNYFNSFNNNIVRFNNSNYIINFKDLNNNQNNKLNIYKSN
jgi:hypothetical protein